MGSGLRRVTIRTRLHHAWMAKCPWRSKQDTFEVFGFWLPRFHQSVGFEALGLGFRAFGFRAYGLARLASELMALTPNPKPFVGPKQENAKDLAPRKAAKQNLVHVMDVHDLSAS